MYNSCVKDNDNCISDKEIIKRQESVIAAFASDYHCILFVDLDTDKVEVYQTNGEDDDWIMENSKSGFENYKKKFLEKYIPLVEREDLSKVFECGRIIDRLDEDPIFYVEHPLLKNGKILTYQTKVVLDPLCTEGNRILIGTHRLYE